MSNTSCIERRVASEYIGGGYTSMNQFTYGIREIFMPYIRERYGAECYFDLDAMTRQHIIAVRCEAVYVEVIEATINNILADTSNTESYRNVPSYGYTRNPPISNTTAVPEAYVNVNVMTDTLRTIPAARHATSATLNQATVGVQSGSVAKRVRKVNLDIK